MSPVQLDWLVAQGVSLDVLFCFLPIRVARGTAKGGRFWEEEDGQSFIVFPQETDTVFWSPVSGALVSEEGRAFALGQDVIDNPGTYALGGRLNIFADPLEWLRAECDGIVVIEWSRAFDRLRDCPRIAVAEPLLATYQKSMKPQRMPAVSVIKSSRRAA